MYGGGGQGGTLSSGSGGSAASGQAQMQDTSGQNMGMQMGMQLANIASQTQLNLANAKKAEAEAIKTAGVDTEVAGANKALAEMNTKNAEVQNQRESRSLEDSLETIKANRDKAVAESASAITGADVSASTKEAQIREINAKAKNEAFKLAVMKNGIELNEAQMQNMLEQIKIGKFNAEKIGLDQVKGKALNQVYEKVMKYFGVDNKAME